MIISSLCLLARALVSDPKPKSDQDQRPEMTDAHQVEIVQQKHNSKDEQNNRSNRDIVLARSYCLRLRINLNRGRSGHIGIYRRRRLRFLQAKHLVQTERIRRGQAELFGLGRLVSFKRHVDWEKCSEQRKDDLHAFLQVAVQRENQHDKNDHMDKCLYELPVVHGAYTGNEAQKACNRGAGSTWPRRRRRHHTNAGRSHIALQTGGDAGFAVNRSHHITLTVFTKRLATGTAVSCRLRLGMYGAVHIWAPSYFIVDLAIWLPSRSMLYVSCCTGRPLVSGAGLFSFCCSGLVLFSLFCGDVVFFFNSLTRDSTSYTTRRLS